MSEEERLEQTRREYWRKRRQRTYATPEPLDFPWGEFDVPDETIPAVKPFELPRWNHAHAPMQGAPVEVAPRRTVSEDFDGPAPTTGELAPIPFADWATGGDVYVPDVEPTADTLDVETADIGLDVEEPAIERDLDDVEPPAEEAERAAPQVKRGLWARMLATLGGKPKQPEPETATETADEAPVEDAAADVEGPADDTWTDDTWEAPADENGTGIAPEVAAWEEAWSSTAYADGDAEDESQLSKKELRAKRKAEAKARRAAKPDAAERKRLAQVAREEREREKKRLAEAAQEEKIEADVARARARREQKAQKEWEKRQKRRDAVRRNGGKEGFWQGTSKPKPMEIANSVRSLSIVLEVNPAEIEAVKMMAEEFAGGRIGDAYDRIYDRLVKDNMTLVEAFEPERLFPPIVHNMLRVGAKTGKPGAALRTAVELLDTSNDNSRKMRNALFEPILLAILSLGVLFLTAWMVMPQFVEMYEGMEMPIGMFTQMVLTFSDVTVWVLGILGAVAAAILAWWYLHGRWDIRVRTAIDRFKLSAPLTGKATQSNEAFQLFNIIDSYLSVGATERETLLGAASTVSNRAVKRQLRATANGLTTGEKTFAQFLDDDMFPRLARALLATGQRTGQTIPAIRHLRDTYQKEARIEGEQAVEKVVRQVSGYSTIVYMLTATIVTIPPLEIFGQTLGYTG
ncbi:type II secretion system F family protein [Microbacterium sp.]|uniref:type II secretion system F family protein n=1 Tax=Microbacterium sp. TaxID=51671 RepID=UPI002B50F262|nr:type II secretion system F family protein [Microbacterium sp.]HWL78037.1 type II secretion system F family protein [Microbacterium sp.]